MNLGSLLDHGKKLSDDVRFALVGTPHFAFCPDTVWQCVGALPAYARSLIGATSWRFWWG